MPPNLFIERSVPTAEFSRSKDRTCFMGALHAAATFSTEERSITALRSQGATEP